MGSFLGAWRGREYVFDPGGAPRGQIFQRRELFLHTDTRIRVLHDCVPGDELDDHPLGALAGHHEYELTVTGATRRYLGPSVRGVGLQIEGAGLSATVGHGLWPDHGFSFTSYSVSSEPGRNLTGGRYVAGALTLALVVGVTEAESRERAGRAGRFPGLRGQIAPESIAATWEGVRVRREPDGTTKTLGAARRVYTARGRWTDTIDGAAPWVGTLAAKGPLLRIRVESPDGPPMVASASRVGWSLWADGVRGSEQQVEWVELLDPTRGSLVTVHRWLTRHVLTAIDVTQLQARATRVPASS